MSSLESKFVFGASLDLDLLGVEVDDKTLIPGLAVASSRAKPLAGALPLSSILYISAIQFILFCLFMVFFPQL